MPTRKHRLLTVAAPVGLLIFAGGIGAVAHGRLGKAPETPATVIRPTTVETRPVALHNSYQVTRHYTGRIESTRTSDVGFELSGTVLDVAVDEGDHVAKGQMLATLDMQTLEARRRELEAELNRASADLQLAHITFERLSGLLNQGAASQQAVDDAREGLAAIDAARALAEARLETNRVDLEKSKLYAPYDAVVVRREADEGRVIEAGEPLLRLQELAAPRARIGLAGRHVTELRAGMERTLFVADIAVDAQIRAVLPIRSGRDRTVDVIFDLDVPPSAARTGDLVSIEIADEMDKSGFWLPIAALRESVRGLWSAAIAVPTDQHYRIGTRTLELIHLESERAFVQGTLEDGDLVVIGGIHKVVPGQIVAIPGLSAQQQGS